MPFTVATAAARLNREMPAAEAACDNAAIAILALAQSAIAASRDTGTRNATTVAAVKRLHNALGKTLETQTELIRAHAAMLDTNRIMGGPAETRCPDDMAHADEAIIGLKLVG